MCTEHKTEISPNATSPLPSGRAYLSGGLSAVPVHDLVIIRFCLCAAGVEVMAFLKMMVELAE